MDERGQSEGILLGKEEDNDDNEEEDIKDEASVEDDFKRKAVALAATFGDSSVHRYECYLLTTIP